MKTDGTNNALIQAAAHAGHEAVRAFCKLLGDDSHKPFDSLSAQEKSVATISATGILDGDHTPDMSHHVWLLNMKAAGWRYGEKKDPEAMTHPALKDYGDLAPEQRVKNELFYQAVKAMASASWRVPQ